MIHINNKEWFDSFGNTYFSANVHLGMDLIMKLPFQYGYNGARQEVENRLAKHFGSCAERWEVRDLLRRNGIEISESKTKSLKRYLSKEDFEDFTPFYKPENLAAYAHYRIMNKIATGNILLQSVGKKTFSDTPVGFTVLGKEIDLTSINWF